MPEAGLLSTATCLKEVRGPGCDPERNFDELAVRAPDMFPFLPDWTFVGLPQKCSNSWIVREQRARGWRSNQLIGLRNALRKLKYPRAWSPCSRLNFSRLASLRVHHHTALCRTHLFVLVILIYIYIYIHMYTYICIHTYTYEINKQEAYHRRRGRDVLIQHLSGCWYHPVNNYWFSPGLILYLTVSYAVCIYL